MGFRFSKGDHRALGIGVQGLGFMIYGTSFGENWGLRVSFKGDQWGLGLRV